MKKRLLAALLPLCVLIAVLSIALPLALAAGEEENAGEAVLQEAQPVELYSIASGTCGDNLTWVLAADGTLTISGTGDMTNYSSSSPAPWYSSRAAVKSIVIENGVTSIGERAFFQCNGLTSVTFPNSVNNIGSDAFWGCSGLTSVTIPGSVISIGTGAFYNCSGLTSVTLPDSVISIESYAFEYCSSLTSVTLPDSVTSIGNDAFFGCTGLTSAGPIGGNYNIQLGWTQQIPDKAFYGCSSLMSVTIPGSASSIGNYAFYNCSGLTSVTIPDSVASIGNYAFFQCSGLTSVTIRGSMTSIGSSAFSNCSGLTSVTIRGSVTSIGSYAFYNCSGLMSVTMPAASSIGNYAFSGCTAVTDVRLTGTGDMADFGTTWPNTPWEAGSKAGKTVTVEIEGGVTSIGNYAFYNCSGLTSVTIPDSVTSIGDDAFYNCSGLTSVMIPDSVASIGPSAFYGCSGLTSVTIGNSVTSIGNYAFYNCSGLTCAAIPDSVTSIGPSAFSNCSGLTSVTMPAASSIGNDAFSGCTAVTEVKLTGTGDMADYSSTYSSAPWYVGLKAGKTVTVEIEDSVTSIGNSAFRECSGLTSMTIPDSVTSIGNSAFRECSGLTSMTIPDSVTSIGDDAFYNCSGLASVTIPDSVTSIGNWAFSGCSGLTNMTIGNSVTSIGNYAFYNCSGLTCAAIPDSVTSIGSYAFYNCSGLMSVTMPAASSIGSYAFCGCTAVTDVKLTGTGDMADYSSTYSSAPWYAGSNVKVEIEGGVTSIGNSAFRGSSGLTSVTIPDSVTSIGNYAFAYCSGLTSVTIPDSVTSIEPDTFYNCSGLISVTIQNGVASIGDSAFYNCSGLTSVAVPGSVAGIGPSAFYNCSGLTSVTIQNGVASIGDSAFRGCSGLTSVTIGNSVTSIGNYAFYNCSGLTGVTIPGSVTSIGSYAFCNCSGLTSVTIQNGVASIGSYAFYNCSGLTSVDILGSVTGIGNYAFYACSGLTSVTIPDSVTSIGNYAFAYCSGLTSVAVPGSVTGIGSYAFYNCSSLKNVYYGGNEEAWNNISVSSGNTVLTGATIYYNTFMDSVGDVVPPNGTIISLTKERYAVMMGDSFEIEATVSTLGENLTELAAGVIWSSSDESILSFNYDKIWPCVNLNGYCTTGVIAETHKPGTVTVTAATADGAQSERTVTVSAIWDSVGMDERDYNLIQGNSLLLFADVSYSGNTTGPVSCTWSTSNADVVAFSDSGLNAVVHYFEEPGVYSDAVDLCALAPGTAVVTCTLWNGLSVSKTIQVYSEEDAKSQLTLQSNYYNTPVKNTEAWETIQNYADDWNRAYSNYIETLSKQLEKVKVSGEEGRAAVINERAAEYQEADENSNSKYINFLDYPTKWPNNWKSYAYQALCEALYDYTDSKISFSGIDPTDGNAIKIVNAVSSSFHTVNESYQYGSITVTVNMQIYGGAQMGTITCSDSQKTCSAAIVSRLEDLKGIVSDYLDEMNELEYSALDNIYSAVAKDILGQSFSEFTQEWLKNEISQQTAEQFQEKGFGNVKDALSYCYSYGKTVYDAIKGGSDSNVSKAISKIEALNIGIDTDSILNAQVKNKASKLEDAGKKLLQALREYELGTLTPESGWDKFWRWVWTCPVGVEIYNNAGVQIGYVGDDGSWYQDGSGIYLEEESGSKTIYCIDDQMLIFKAVGTDYGILNCSFEEYSDGKPVGRTNFYDILLDEGKTITAVLSENAGEGMTRSVSLSVEGTTIEMDEYIPVTEDACVYVTALTESENGGSVAGSGAYTRGDAVVLHAAPNSGYCFAGWYDGQDILVSMATVYEFAARKDVQLTAKFQENERTLENGLIDISKKYADICEVAVEQEGDQFTLHMTGLPDVATIPDATAILAEYDGDGKAGNIVIIEGVPTENGYDFIGITPQGECKLFLLDHELCPIIKAYLNTGG